MSFQEEFDESMFQCSLVIIEPSLNTDHNPKYNTKLNYFDIYGDGDNNNIDYQIDADVLDEETYNLEIRMNNKDNTLIYATDENIADFFTYFEIKNTSNKEIYQIAEDAELINIVLNKPFIFTKDLCVMLYDITMHFDVDINNGYVYHTRIQSLSVTYHVHPWLKNIRHNLLGEIDTVDSDYIPNNILYEVKKFKTHLMAKQSFSVLWLYRYYTGDIYIVNVEPKDNKFVNVQYYVVAHLHIVNNVCGNCHEDCVSKWSESELDSLEIFIFNNSNKFNVIWYNGASVINFNGNAFITQSNDCCFVDKTIIDFNIY
jgi:hypothetical protein